MKISVLLIHEDFSSQSLANNNWFQEELLSEENNGDHIVKTIQMLDSHTSEPIGKPYQSYYAEDGGYIGDKKWFDRLRKLGIKPERASPDHNVCSIGYSQKDGKYYGWSHRAMFGFKLGDKIKPGDCAYKPPKDPTEILDSIRDFWSEPHNIIELDGNTIVHWSPDYKKLREKYGQGFFYQWNDPMWVTTFGTANKRKVWEKLKEAGYMLSERRPITDWKTGRGEYVIKTDNEAKQAAKDFAESVSKVQKMKINISLSSYPDVDHIQGKRITKTETIHNKYKIWKQHADLVNTKFYYDDAEIISDSNKEIYTLGDIIFAYWDKFKSIGTINILGKQLS